MKKRQIPLSVNCPKCATKWDINASEKIIMPEDSVMKPAVLDGEIFRYSCPACGNVTSVCHPCLYVDRDKKFMVAMSPDAEEQPVTALNDFTEKDRLPYIFRRVDNLKDFVEKLNILDAGLNDKALELTKAIALSKYLNKSKSEIHGMCFDGFQDNTVRFAMILTNGEITVASVPASLYEEIRHMPSLCLDTAEVVDLNWAIDLFKSHKNFN